jgi:peptidoglycan-associated lipoprotein
LLRRDKNNKWGEVRFEYARTLKMNGKYDEAIIEFQQFVAETEDPVKKELAQAELTGCEMALSDQKAELDVMVENA